MTRRLRKWRWRALVLGLGLPLVLTACSDSADAPPAGQSSSPSASVQPSDNLFTDFVAVGGGRNAYVQCAGSGSPTIILESGDESDHIQWRLVEPSLAERTRTCSYDRLGTGASDKATGCRQLKDLNGDLEALLRATGEDGPYVLVGTSGGGFLMAGFAYAHPQDVKGMAFVETPHAIIAEEAPPELLQELKCDSPMNEERRDYVAVENEAWANRERIGDIPLVVISNDYGDDYDNEEQRTNVEDQKGWFKLSPQARQVVVTSGHDVPENEPDLVIKEILQVLEATQKR
jgi:alpha/beta hydrolase fold